MIQQLDTLLRQATVAAVQELFDVSTTADNININLTKDEFDGELSIVVFPFVKAAKQSPEKTGEAIGAYLLEHNNFIASFNVIKGFLNIVTKDSFWVNFLTAAQQNNNYATLPNTGKKVVVEYCGPNTNKPLHLGHIRNMVLGFSVSKILEAAGNDVSRVNIYNDRGIAICKSMLSWQKNANGATPQSTSTKGDHFVGQYYVLFGKQLEEQVQGLIDQGFDEKEANKKASSMLEAQAMLRMWEEGNESIRDLWHTMNSWVYDGFGQTFKRLGVDFVKHYHESEYYLAGKALVEEGVEAGKFITKEDGSTWVDLTDVKLDEKILLRNDGTSVYLTQDLGIAQARYNDFKMDQSIYVVADEQDYHFKVLKETLKKLEKPYAEGIYHLSYGMVDLPSGRMKTREGTTVDADDLMDEMYTAAKQATEELGKIDSFSEDEAHQLYEMLGKGALKFFILNVGPRKRMIFNPEESIALKGDTGTFIQYTYVRTQAVQRKYAADNDGQTPSIEGIDSITESEKELLLHLHRYPEVLQEAADGYAPSTIAAYALNAAKCYNRFYANTPILKAESAELLNFRVALSAYTGKIIKAAMGLLGIQVPNRM